MEIGAGIKPANAGLQSATLIIWLSYHKMVHIDRVEPARLSAEAFKAPMSAIPIKYAMAGPVGFEPTVACATDR